MSSSWATDESAADLWLEQSTYAGYILAAMAYGVHLTVGFMTLYHIAQRRKQRNPWWNALIVSTLIGCGTATSALGLYFGQKAWINLRGYPGGPLAYINNMQSQPIDTAGSAISTITCLVGDGLLLWRAYILWGSKWYVVAIPILQWIAVAVLGGILAQAQAQPASTLFTTFTMEIGVPYFSLELSLNIICTTLILIPLLIARRNMASTLGNTHARMYTSLAAMIIESALPNAVVSFIFLMLYVTNNTAENLFIMMLLQIQCIAPEMIILRIVNGHAWDHSTRRELTAAATRSKLYELSDGRTKTAGTGGHSRLVFKSYGEDSNDVKIETTQEISRDVHAV